MKRKRQQRQQEYQQEDNEANQDSLDTSDDNQQDVIHQADKKRKVQKSDTLSQSSVLQSFIQSGQPKSSEVPEVPELDELSKVSNTSDVSVATITSDASDATNTSDASDATNTSDASDATNTSDASDATNTSDASDATNTSNASDATNTSNASDATNTSNALGVSDVRTPYKIFDLCGFSRKLMSTSEESMLSSTWMWYAKHYLLALTSIHQDIIPFILFYIHEIKFSPTKSITLDDHSDNSSTPGVSWDQWAPTTICIHKDELIAMDYTVRWGGGAIHIFDVSTGRLLRQLKEGFMGISSFDCVRAYSNKLLVSSIKTKSIRVFSLLDGKLLKEFKDDRLRCPTRMCISTEEETLYVADVPLRNMDRELEDSIVVVSIKHWSDWHVVKKLPCQAECVAMDVESNIEANEEANVEANIKTRTAADKSFDKSFDKSSSTVYFAIDSNIKYYISSKAENTTSKVIGMDVKTGKVNQVYIGNNFDRMSLSGIVVYGTQIIVCQREHPYPVMTVFDRDTGVTSPIYIPTYGKFKVSGPSDLALYKPKQELFVCDPGSGNIIVFK